MSYYCIDKLYNFHCGLCITVVRVMGVFNPDLPDVVDGVQTILAQGNTQFHFQTIIIDSESFASLLFFLVTDLTLFRYIY